MDNGGDLPVDEGVGDEELFEVVEQDEGFEEDGEFVIIFHINQLLCLYQFVCIQYYSPTFCLKGNMNM